jgi:type II secretory pathway component PulC
MGVRGVLLGCLLLGLLGCSLYGKGADERRLSMLRPVVPKLETQEVSLSREKLLESLKHEQLTRRVRLVQIFNTAAAVSQATIPEYRLFDIDPHSAYYFIGLRNGDVLMGINGRIVVNPDLLSDYVMLLPNEKESQLEIERGTEAILFKYKIVEP